MTKQDYKKLAEVFEITKPATPYSSADLFCRAAGAQWRIMARRIAFQLKMDNKNFNEDKFYDAIGLDKEDR